MDRKKAIEILKKNKPTSDPRRCGVELCEAVDVAIAALEEKDHRCNNCRHGDYAQGNVFYCLSHSSFHDGNEYCSEWEAEQE